MAGDIWGQVVGTWYHNSLNNSAALKFPAACFPCCFGNTPVCSQHPPSSSPGLMTISCKRESWSSERSSPGRAELSSPGQSWGPCPLASSTCACRSAPSTGACSGLTPACGGSGARTLQDIRRARLQSRRGAHRSSGGTRGKPSTGTLQLLLSLLSLAPYLCHCSLRKGPGKGGKR